MTESLNPSRGDGTVIPIVIDDAGVIRIGTAPGRPPRCAPLEVESGLLTVDPFLPDAAPYAELGEAPDWIPDVYGWTAAERLDDALRQAEQPGGLPVSTSAPFEPGELHADISRLAVARWLTAWGDPVLDRDLLDAEIGMLLIRVTDVLPDADGLAHPLLSSTAERIASLARNALTRHPADADQSAADEEILEIASASSWVLSNEHPEWKELTAIAEASRSRLLSERTVVDAVLAQPLPEVFQPGAVTAPGRDDENDPWRWRRASVDWGLVAPRVLDPAENTLMWRVSGGVEPVVEVQVTAVASADRTTEVWARVYRPGPGLPVAVGRLEFREGATPAWVGRLPLRRSDDPAVDLVEVFMPGYAAAPSPVPGFAAAERDGVRVLTRLRAARTARDPERLGKAARQLRRAANRIEEANPGDLLAPKLLRLADAAVSLLDRRTRPAGTGGAAGAPDLASEAWAPMLAERLLAYPDLFRPTTG